VTHLDLAPIGRAAGTGTTAAATASEPASSLAGDEADDPGSAPIGLDGVGSGTGRRNTAPSA